MKRALAFGLGLLIVGLASGVRAQDNPPAEAPSLPEDDLPPPTDLRIVAPELPVPRNGSILIIATIEGMPLDAPIVQVSKTVGSTTTTFGGAVRQVFRGYWKWTPVEPLEVGEHLVSIAHPSIGAMSAMITIVDDVVLEPPMLTSQPIAAVSTYPSEYASCQRLSGSELIDDTSFVSRVAGQVTVSANLTFSVEASVVHQYLYRAFMNAGDVTPFVSSEAPVIVGPYTEQAEQYCFGVEVMDIATSAVHPYPGVEFCVAHGELDSLTEREPGMLDDAVYRYACMHPPSGYEELWCQANADCIEIWRTPETIEAGYCQSYFDICPDAMRPDAGTSGTGGIGGTGGTSGAGPGGGGFGGAHPDAGFVDPNTPDAGADDRDDNGDSSGCSIARASSASQRSALLHAMLVALAGLRARRRR